MTVRRVRLVLFLLALGAVVAMNILPDKGMTTFKEQASFAPGFGPSRGWPFCAVASVDDEGLLRIARDTVAYKNVLGGRYPHLAVNWLTVLVDGVIAAVILALAWLLPRLLTRNQAAT